MLKRSKALIIGLCFFVMILLGAGSCLGRPIAPSTDYSDLLSKISALTTRVTTLEAQVAELSNTSADNRIDSLAADVAQLNSQLQTIQSGLAALDSRLQDLESSPVDPPVVDPPVEPPVVPDDPTVNDWPVLASDNFEGFLGSFWSNETAKYDYSLSMVSDPAGQGDRAARFELRSTDAWVNGSTRAELAKAPRETPREEHWYYVSTYLPADFVYDNAPEGIFQWHNYPDFALGESWTSSPLYLFTQKGHYYISRLWDDEPVSTNSSMIAKGYREYIDLGDYSADQGKWVTWAFHVRWGWLPEHDTILEIYKDGQLIINRNGLPNTTNDQNGVYMKIGIYKWGWASGDSSTCTTRVVYYDDFCVK